jgi:lipopolysaccharide/colanic/teichoic acid biosynthesis glycosyltransferase
MRHSLPINAKAQRSLVTRQRFAALGALAVVTLVPLGVRWDMLGAPDTSPATTGSLIANAIAVVIAVWTRFSLQTYPGTRSSAIILPSISAAHGIVLVIMLMARLPYDRVSTLLGYLVHLSWAYALYFIVQRRLRQRIAVVPVGQTADLMAIDRVDWQPMHRADLAEIAGCDAIVADFSDLSDEWEAFLADAALEGRVVYQPKQLAESLTGKVRIEHLSENSFGYLVPMRAYAYLKSAADWLFAVLLLPLVAPVLIIAAIAVRLDSKGPALFRQMRVGRRGVPIRIFKFRTMLVPGSADLSREAAMTCADDDRITRVGAFLRKTRIDELPQIFNILKLEMSWIGPRPEAEVLSSWYVGEIPFYRYRHVVKPGISGWAQVNQGHVANVDEVHEKLQYDFFYIKYFSPWLDLVILFKTVRTMLSGFGAK